MLRKFMQRFWTVREGVGAVVARLLREYASLYWKTYATALGLGAAAAGCTASVAYLIGHVIDQAYIYHDIAAILFVCGLVIVIYTFKGLSTYGQAVLVARVTNQIIADGQRRIFDKILQESLGYFADRHSSELMARVVYAAGAPASVLNTLINSVGRDLPTLVGLVTVMLLQAPALSLICFLVAPPAILFVRHLVKRARDLMDRQYTSNAAMLETVQETVQGLRVIKAFNLENEMRCRIGTSVDAIKATGNEMAQIINRPGPLMETFAGIAVAIVFAYGGYQVVMTGAKPGEFFSFATAFLLAYEPAKRLSQLHLSLSNSLFGVKLLFQVLDAAASEPEEVDKPSILVESGGIEFKDVIFAYRKDEYVLHNLSFTAASGKVTALVGPSGGGKSTIFNLILRFYDIDRGAIMIDGRNISAVSRKSLRGQIGYIGQDIFLFRGTVRENIAAGNPAATQEEVIEAAKAAFAHDFIVSFPRGYDTPVGELGMQLSTGQRQRIGIARTLLKHANLILLDEPTSALDTASERQVSDAISKLCMGKTALVIAHRLHTVVHADCIHVVEGGVIVESGSHDELMLKAGRYAELFELQFRRRNDSLFQENNDPHLTLVT